MSEQDPKRLLEGGGSSGELRSLLEAGRSEMPDNTRLAMLAVKMGIVGGLGGAGAAGAAGAGGAGGGGAGTAGAVGGGKAVATAATAAKVGMAVKVIGAIAVASAAGAGAVVVANRQVETATRPAGMVAGPSANASANANANANASASANANANADVESGGDADAGGVVTPPVTTRTARTAANTASAEAKDEGPEAEVKLVQRAQDALRGSRPAEALALCNDHAKRFPNGMVTQECEVIAVEALVKTGRKDEARKRADRFKARFPGSASIRRLDVLLGE
jgi:hypothetical protein